MQVIAHKSIASIDVLSDSLLEPSGQYLGSGNRRGIQSTDQRLAGFDSFDGNLWVAMPKTKFVMPTMAIQ